MKKGFPWSDRSQPSENGRIVTGALVVLREKRLEDAPDDYRWRTDEELAELDATRPLDMPYEQFLKYAGEELVSLSPWSLRFAVDTLGGKHIGNCMLYDIDRRAGEAEMGIVIGDRDYLGKGYGTDAVSSLLGHVWASTDLKRVYLHTLEWNQRARRSFAKAGFREVRKVRRSGMDFIRMDVSRKDAHGVQNARRDQAAGEAGPPASTTGSA